MYRNVVVPLIVCLIAAVALYAYLQHDRYGLLAIERQKGSVDAY